MNEVSKDGIQYRNVEGQYFEKRQLNRAAGKWMLYGLGIAAVISGDFSGWNLGIGQGGFGGLIIATILIATMYIGLAYSLSEMSPALPHTGGAYSFARTAMGPWGGFVTGLGENMEYVLTTAVVGTFMVGYMQELLPNNSDGSPVVADWLLLLIIYTVFVTLNIIHVSLSLTVALIVGTLSVLALCVFFVGALTSDAFSMANLYNIEPEEGGSKFLPMGVTGILYAMPFAVWFFLGIEQLPLAAEESHDPKKDIPFALLWGIFTLVCLAILVGVLNTGVVGAEQMKDEGEPFFVGITTVYEGSVSRTLLAGVAVISFIASFHAIMFAYGRNIYSLSRAGYFPTVLSKTSKTKTPAIALITGAIIGYSVVMIMWQTFYKEEGLTGAAGILLNMAVFGAMIAYVSQAASYIIIKKMAINRPYISPVGSPGAWVSVIISTTTFIIILSHLFGDDASYKYGLLGCVIWFVVCLGYFQLYAKNKMILSPEEEFAVEHRKA